jgi:hypothetical protein
MVWGTLKMECTYQQIVKNLDDLIMREKIDNLIKKDKIPHKSSLHLNSKTYDLRCKVTIKTEPKEEIMDLPPKPKRKIIDLYEVSIKRKPQNKMCY